MKNQILILLFSTMVIHMHIAGCQRLMAKPDNRQQERVSDAAKQEIKKAQEIISQDGHFLKYANGVVYDINTNLEWYAGPEKNTSFDEAKNWVANLKVAGGHWRMPTRFELATLYKEGAGKTNMTPLFETTGMWVWAGEIKDSSAWTFNFEYGYGHWDFRSNSRYFRAFAVRYR